MKIAQRINITSPEAQAAFDLLSVANGTILEFDYDEQTRVAHVWFMLFANSVPETLGAAYDAVEIITADLVGGDLGIRYMVAPSGLTRFERKLLKAEIRHDEAVADEIRMFEYRQWLWRRHRGQYLKRLYRRIEKVVEGQ